MSSSNERDSNTLVEGMCGQVGQRRIGAIDEYKLQTILELE